MSEVREEIAEIQEYITSNHADEVSAAWKSYNAMSKVWAELLAAPEHVHLALGAALKHGYLTGQGVQIYTSVSGEDLREAFKGAAVVCEFVAQIDGWTSAEVTSREDSYRREIECTFGYDPDNQYMKQTFGVHQWIPATCEMKETGEYKTVPVMENICPPDPNAGIIAEITGDVELDESALT